MSCFRVALGSETALILSEGGLGRGGEAKIGLLERPSYLEGWWTKTGSRSCLANQKLRAGGCRRWTEVGLCFPPGSSGAASEGGDVGLITLCALSLLWSADVAHAWPVSGKQKAKKKTKKTAFQCIPPEKMPWYYLFVCVCVCIRKRKTQYICNFSGYLCCFHIVTFHTSAAAYIKGK